MIELMPVRPLHDSLFIDIIDRNVTFKDLGNGKGLHLLSDDEVDKVRNPLAGKHSGVRPRWARILSIGPKVEDDLSVGDLVLCDELKWSHKIPMGRIGLETVWFWRISVQDILLINTEASRADYLSEMRQKLSVMIPTLGVTKI